MLLCPQHFQIASERVEDLVAYRTGRINPLGWGVDRFEYDALRLQEGVLSVEFLEGVLPDGLILNYTSENDGDLELKCDEACQETDEAQDEVDIYVAVAREAATEHEDKSLGRYRSFEKAAVADIYSVDDTINIPSLRPRLHLFARKPSDVAYVSMPIMRLCVVAGRFEVSPFIPPMMQVTKGSRLYQRCEGLSLEIRKKVNELLERRSHESSHADSAPLGPSAQLMYLATALPDFEATYRSGVAHPFEMYRSLCRLGGTVYGLLEDTPLPVFDAYSHVDIAACWGDVEGFIQRCIQEVSSRYRLQRVFNEEGRYLLHIREEESFSVQGLHGQVVYVGVPRMDNVTEEETDAWFMGSTLGLEGDIDGLVRRRMLGVKRERISGEPNIGLHAGTRQILYRVCIGDSCFSKDTLARMVLRPVAGSQVKPEFVMLCLNPSTQAGEAEALHPDSEGDPR